MQTPFALLALASAVLAAVDPTLETPDQEFANYLQEICFPYNETTGDVLFNAPCNAAQNIIIQCTYGENYNFTDSSDFDESTPQLSNTTQQACICESQFWDQQMGCNLCFEKHGDTDFTGVSDNVFTSLSSSYCAASPTPTLAFADWLEIAGESALHTISAPMTTATSYSDPIGNKTAVSLYFTPSVSGSAGWDAAVATGASAKVVNGQIVATASGAITKAASGTSSGTRGASSSGTAGAQATTTNAAAGTPQAMAAAAGVIGIAGLVAFL